MRLPGMRRMTPEEPSPALGRKGVQRETPCINHVDCRVGFFIGRARRASGGCTDDRYGWSGKILGCPRAVPRGCDDGRLVRRSVEGRFPVHRTPEAPRWCTDRNTHAWRHRRRNRGERHADGGRWDSVRRSPHDGVERRLLCIHPRRDAALRSSEGRDAAPSQRRWSVVDDTGEVAPRENARGPATPVAGRPGAAAGRRTARAPRRSSHTSARSENVEYLIFCECGHGLDRHGTTHAAATGAGSRVVAFAAVTPPSNRLSPGPGSIRGMARRRRNRPRNLENEGALTAGAVKPRPRPQFRSTTAGAGCPRNAGDVAAAEPMFGTLQANLVRHAGGGAVIACRRPRYWSVAAYAELNVRLRDLRAESTGRYGRSPPLSEREPRRAQCRRPPALVRAVRPAGRCGRTRSLGPSH